MSSAVGAELGVGRGTCAHGWAAYFGIWRLGTRGKLQAMRCAVNLCVGGERDACRVHTPPVPYHYLPHKH